MASASDKDTCDMGALVHDNWDGNTDCDDLSSLFSDDWDGTTATLGRNMDAESETKHEGTSPPTDKAIDDEPNTDRTSESQNAPTSSSKAFVVQPFNIIPLTVKQIVQCDDVKVSVHGTKARVFTLIGLVLEVSVKDSKLCVDLDDQTAAVRCIQHLNSRLENANKDWFFPVPKAYVKVIGVLRRKKGINFVLVYRFFPVHDLNQMTCHILEVMKTEMELKKLTESEADEKSKHRRIIGFSDTYDYADIVGHFGYMYWPGTTGGSNAK